MEGTPPAQPQTLPPTLPPTDPMLVKPHRGPAILVLGIVGIVVCFVCGIIAWVMGTGDLKEMDLGVRDPEGRGLTKAGMICGIVGTALAALGLVWWLIAVFVFGTSCLGVLGNCY